jgi:glycosyltransferase involved in cell wall biosynthesis
VIALAVDAVLVGGCLLWLLSIAMLLRTLRAVPVLADLPPEAVPAPPPGSAREAARWPSLSVVTPACDEADTLPAAMATRLASDYPDFELVLVDDRSRDGTGAVVDALAADPRVVPVHVRELPEGWLGKVHAMHVGLARARGEWLVFSDADVHYEPGALRRIVAFAEAQRLDFLAVMPELLGATLPTNAAVAAFSGIFALTMRPWKVADPRSSAAIGVGAFNMVRRAALERAGGFRPLRLEVADDIGLGAMLKQSGARCAVASGRGLIRLRWYATLPEMAAGLEKGLFAHAGRCEAWRLLLLSVLLLARELLPWAALLSGRPAVVGLGALTLVLGLVTAMRGLAWAGRPRAEALLLPLGGVLMAWIVARAGVVGGRRGGVLWRGTLYPSELLREAMSWEGAWRGGRRRE